MDKSDYIEEVFGIIKEKSANNLLQRPYFENDDSFFEWDRILLLEPRKV